MRTVKVNDRDAIQCIHITFLLPNLCALSRQHQPYFVAQACAITFTVLYRLHRYLKFLFLTSYRLSLRYLLERKIYGIQALEILYK